MYVCMYVLAQIYFIMDNEQKARICAPLIVDRLTLAIIPGHKSQLKESGE